MKGKINIIKGFLTDALFWIYFLSCLVYLGIHWKIIEKYTAIWIMIPAIILTIIFFLLGDSAGRKLFYPSIKSSLNWKKTFSGWILLISFILTFVVGWNIVQVDVVKFFTKFQNAGGITSGIFDPHIITYKITNKTITILEQQAIPPGVLKKLDIMKNRAYPSSRTFKKRLKRYIGKQDFDKYGYIIKKSVSKDLDMFYIALSALVETIFLALLATLFAIPFAFILSFFAARNLMPRNIIGNSIYVLIRSIATFFRSVEAIVWAIIFSVWVGIGPFAGMLALMIHSIAALTKLYSEQIENIDNGPVEAITATGANTLQIWIYAVIPQILSPYLAFTIYRWDINVRMATIVGFVGGGGIGLLLQQQQQMLQWQNVGLIIWLIAIVVWIMDMVSAKIRENLLEN